ncbi:uncharacterized protein LOC129751219 [Uranotaenia lowii]|uniref:uncharacterized protein LOC129751219 n=1 Tax=Uranotaenia lowii TaxID=190385 RepID=UPI00247AE4E9|nr:uncharacterized protein LOC129751219 [Uranotaenia lowii]
METRLVPVVLSFLVLLKWTSHVSAQLGLAPYPAIVQMGTFNSTNQVCFYKRINRNALSPKVVTFQNPTTLPINYILVQQTPRVWGGFDVEIVGGALGSPLISLQITASASRFTFANQIKIEMMCTNPSTTSTTPATTTTVGSSTTSGTSTVASTTMSSSTSTTVTV